MAIADHVREIEAAWQGKASSRDPYVIQSWRRCLDEHRLDPAIKREAVIVPEVRLKEHRQQAEELTTIARSELERLYGHMANQAYVLLLADRQGVTVEFRGDPRYDNELRKTGLYLGSDWAESHAGTCAVGACLETGEALVIHQTDHFDVTHTPLSCTAAPIYDTTGWLAAVLDISLLKSPKEKASQNLARHLVTTSVRRIELANLMARTRRQWVLRFALCPEFLDVDPEGAIAIDDSGRIAGLTHGAARMLSSAAGLDWREPGQLIGQKISRFLDLTIDELPTLMRGRPSHQRVLRACDGNLLFAHAIEPPLRPRAAPAALSPALRQLGGDTPEINALKDRAAKLSRTGLPVLIHGETGTGKEYMARAIHEASGVKGSFVAVNCAAIPELLAEAELFGYAPGAFTGAAPRGRRGLVEEADGGTLFLDEIGDMPLGLQTRLLRVLAERTVQPVGATRPRPVSFRLISASHRDLKMLVAEKRFREDLYYRLNVAELAMPPLRTRGDFDWLVTHMLARKGRQERRITLAPAALAALRSHNWPGNLRELDNALSVAAALSEDGEITPANLPSTIGGALQPALDRTDEAGLLQTALKACGGNVSALARQLGCDRTTVHRRMRRFGLSGRMGQQR